MPEFIVRFVDEDALPAQHAWVAGVTDQDEFFVFVKHGAARCSVTWERIWRYVETFIRSDEAAA